MGKRAQSRLMELAADGAEPMRSLRDFEIGAHE